ncbi:MAG TPA: MATE family efflux transporter [Caulobacteraceae bacterium]
MSANADVHAQPRLWRWRLGPTLAPILALAAPLTAWFALQSLVNLAVTGALGGVGDLALAGVGAASTLSGMVLALLFGFDTAVQATIARRNGAGRQGEFGQALVDALTISAPLGFVLSAGLWLAAPTLLAGIAPSAAAAAVGAANLRAAAPSIALMALTIPVNAVWIGQGKPKLAFLVTALQAPVQIGAAFALVFGLGPLPALGATGAGVAATISALAGLVLQLALVARPGAVAGLRHARPRAGAAFATLGIAWPISLQQSLLQLGFVALYLIIARLGVGVVAAANVLVTLASAPAQLALGLGVAAATLVGQTLGRGDPAEARRWGWRSARLSLFASLPFALVALIAPRPVLGLFLHDPATLTIAVWPLRITAVSIIARAAIQVLSFALRGAGATRIGAGIPFAAQWLVTLPLSWWAAVPLGFGLVGVASVQAAVTIAEAAVTALVWSGARWTFHRTLSRTT